MTIKIILLEESGKLLKNYTFDKQTRIIDIKKNILKEFYNDKGYIDINILLEKTKRTFGKFNLDPGLLPRIFDNKTLEDFGLEDFTLNIKVDSHTNENINSFDKKVSKNINNNSKYIPPNRKRNLKDTSSGFEFKEDDFPVLG